MVRVDVPPAALAVALAAALGAGCRSRQADRREVPGARDAAVAAVDGDALFPTARPTVERMAVPARFAAPLPATDAELDGAPPAPYVDAALAADTDGMRARLLAALARVTPPMSEQLRGYYEGRLLYAPPATCAWIATVTAGGAPAPARDVFWIALARCGGPAAEAALARDDAPDVAVIDYWFEAAAARVPFMPRVARAAAAVARGEERYEARKIGFAFAAMDGPEVVPAMRALQRSIADPERRALVALGLLRHPDPAARRLGVEACAQPRVGRDAMCTPDELAGGGGEADAPPRSAADAVRRYDYDQAAALARFPRAELVDALARCTTVRDPDFRADCLRRLASLDRAEAVAIARRLAAAQAAARAALAAGGDDDYDVEEDDLFGLTDVITALLAFPAAGDLERALASHGFTAAPRGPHADPAPPPTPVTAEDALEAMGRLTSFDTETGQWPNEHDRLLADLAASCAPALAGVLFEERAPREYVGDEPYTLVAYADGRAYRVPARNYGDWYDVEAVVGLVNALLAARGSDLRMAPLATGDQVSHLLCGPRAGITALVRRGLVRAGAPEAGEELGKDFEDRVFRSLDNEP